MKESCEELYTCCDYDECLEDLEEKELVTVNDILKNQDIKNSINNLEIGNMECGYYLTDIMEANCSSETEYDGRVYEGIYLKFGIMRSEEQENIYLFVLETCNEDYDILDYIEIVLEIKDNEVIMVNKGTDNYNWEEQ